MNTEIPEACIQAIANARHIVVLTGAGVSAESGIPTFRDALEGLWAKYDPRDLATPDAFERDPELVSRWYDMRRLMCRDTSPNPGHVAIAELQRRTERSGGTFTLLTQNIDGLHQRAGASDVIELHGSLWKWRCASCHTPATDLPEPLAEFPSPCACGGFLRPGVVWFGEALSHDDLTAAAGACDACDVFLSVGTSGVVYPVAGLIDLVSVRGAPTIEVNPDVTPQSGQVTWSLRGPAGEVLPALVDSIGA